MRAFFGAVIAIGIAAVAGGLFCAVYTVGEYIVETEYEKRYGAQNWEEKRRERKKRAMKELKYSLQGTTQSNGLTGGVPPVRFSM